MNHQTPQQLIDNALEHCQAFTAILREENEALTTKKLDALEDPTKRKRHVAVKLEVAMTQVQENKDILSTSGAVTQKMQQLQVFLSDYKEQARKNVVLLKASHEATTQFIQMVRSAVTAHKPQPKTYGNNGQMQDNSGSTNLVIKNV